jgi:histidinol phosphatase-like enzyme
MLQALPQSPFNEKSFNYLSSPIMTLLAERGVTFSERYALYQCSDDTIVVFKNRDVRRKDV